jgi:predicted DNA-binding ribbon-helix-helix protein
MTAPRGQSVVKRSLSLAGHRTSVSLEDAFWTAIKRIATARGTSVPALIAEIDRTRAGNLSSAIRVFVLRELERPDRNLLPASGR